MRSRDYLLRFRSQEEIKMTNHKYRCPVCGAKSFEVTAHVTQDWKIDCYGTFLEALNECVEVTHYPDEMDIWSCSNCDFSAEGKSFLVNTHS